MTLLLGQAPPPLGDVLVRLKRPGMQQDPFEGKASIPFADWLSRASQSISQGPVRLNTVSALDQGASIAATDLSNGALSAGLYRLTFYAHIVQAASTSSSLTVTFDWTYRGFAASAAAAAITGNTTGTTGSGSVLVSIGAATPVRYATTYVSVGGTAMAYDLWVVLEGMAG